LVKEMIVSITVVKLLIAGLDTPFLYAVRWFYQNTNPRRGAIPVSQSVPG
jgi:uncharacterized PurR-regulated membrane protein YhhQ (DUF165 family)